MQLGSEFQEMQPNKPDTSVAGFQHRLPSTKENERVSRSSVDTHPGGTCFQCQPLELWIPV